MASSGRAYVTNARPFDPLVTVSIGMCTCKIVSEKSQIKSRKEGGRMVRIYYL